MLVSAKKECYIVIMRRICVLLICGMIFFAGCQKPSDDGEVMDISISELSASSSDGSAAYSGLSPASSQTSFAVVQTAAYAYEENGAVMLYGAVEYENTGNIPMCLSELSFSFTGTQNAVHDFLPTLASYDILAPGERSYAAAWFPGEGFTAGEDVELRVKLGAAPASSPAIGLTVDDVFFADNYPAFTTMSGTLRNDSGSSCSLNMVYAGLYDENDEFLGVWYFPQNAQLDSGDSVRFTTHLRSFPLNDLAERGIHCSCRAFGFN